VVHENFANNLLGLVQQDSPNMERSGNVPMKDATVKGRPSESGGWTPAIHLLDPWNRNRELCKKCNEIELKGSFAGSGAFGTSFQIRKAGMVFMPFQNGFAGILVALKERVGKFNPDPAMELKLALVLFRC
jgi:hypothetical protein